MWSQSDIAWLAQSYPTLEVLDEKTIEGKLSYRMLYRDGRNYIKPNGALVSENDGTYLCDTYSLKILWPDGAEYPYAYDTDSRIIDTAKLLGKDPLDLHLLTGSKENAFCLASPMELEAEFNNEFSMQKYVEQFLIPYLFGQTYYRENNGVWPWPELSHDYPGHLEWLARRPSPTRFEMWRTAYEVTKRIGNERACQLFMTRPRLHLPCFCGSDKKASKCHPDAQQGISIIRGAISQHRFSLGDILYDES